MKAVIQEVIFRKEFETKYGIMYQFAIKYDNQVAFYSSKSKEQTKFITGKESEFTEEQKTFKDKNGVEKPYIVIKPLLQNRQSNFGKALNKEKSRYSGFAVSYSKDLVCAGKLSLEELAPLAWTLFELMVEMDKTLES